MAGRTGATSFDLMVFMMLVPMVMSRLIDAESNHSPALDSTGPHDEMAAARGEFKMSFMNEEWQSNNTPSTCTCTCYPGASPKAAPSQQRSPAGRKKSPPPAPYWPPSPIYDNPAAPNTKSPVSSFSSPPPPAVPYDDVPSYEQPAPVMASPQTFVPPPPPVY